MVTISTAKERHQTNKRRNTCANKSLRIPVLQSVRDIR
ncbi:MAG: hypothetical protein LBQ54_01770 [Planctomycetaceae bacterium]|nr:hypothetical protein [Planctomycetaceae bacterium]